MALSRRKGGPSGFFHSLSGNGKFFARGDPSMPEHRKAVSSREAEAPRRGPLAGYGCRTFSHQCRSSQRRISPPLNWAGELGAGSFGELVTDSALNSSATSGRVARIRSATRSRESSYWLKVKGAYPGAPTRRWLAAESRERGPPHGPFARLRPSTRWRDVSTSRDHRPDSARARRRQQEGDGDRTRRRRWAPGSKRISASR